ncbi:hypothetical protein HDE_03460 [Halotydeus destructor]|nr:hypothetical protein HDE_03460 [Halotydeus destructor]
MSDSGQDGADNKKRFEEGKALLQRLGFQLTEAEQDNFTVSGRLTTIPTGPTSGRYSINNPGHVIAQRRQLPLSGLPQQTPETAADSSGQPGVAMATPVTANAEENVAFTQQQEKLKEKGYWFEEETPGRLIVRGISKKTNKAVPFGRLLASDPDNILKEDGSKKAASELPDLRPPAEPAKPEAAGLRRPKPVQEEGNEVQATSPSPESVSENIQPVSESTPETQSAPTEAENAAQELQSSSSTQPTSSETPSQGITFTEQQEKLKAKGYWFVEDGPGQVKVMGLSLKTQQETSYGRLLASDPENILTEKGKKPATGLPDVRRPAGADVTQSQAPAVPSAVRRIERALGSAAAFVATDPHSQLGDPRTWPQLDTSLLSPECEARADRHPQDKFKWFLDGRKHCIDVCQERDKVFPTSRFYSKRRQTLDDLVWRRDRDLRTAAQLNAEYGYTQVDRNVKSVSEPTVKVTERNSKQLTDKLNLAIVQASDDALTVVQGQTGSTYLVAKGAANFGSATSIPVGQGYVSPKTVKVDPGEGVDVNGLRLERALFEAGRLCRRANILARTVESFHDARMWTVTRDSDVRDKQFSLTILDIGVRGRSSPYRDLGWVNHLEKQYHAHMAKVDKVRLFVALVPDSFDKDPPGMKNQINVVLLQDVLPVEGELHIIYLIHHRGSYYSHPVYENVKLVDVDLSGAAERAIFSRHIDALMGGKETIPTGQFTALESLNEKIGCGQDVNERRWVSLRLRGYHNEFWKRVVEPARAGAGSEQEALFKRWQPFYMHDFSGRQYLAEPLGNFKPEEIHVVNMAQLLTLSGLLSGIGSGFNSGTESAPVRIFTFMVQVEVPDDKIRCVIYDFAHMEGADSTNFDSNAERDTLGYFRFLSKLKWDKAEPPVPFVTGKDSGGRTVKRGEESYEEVSRTETNLVHIQCPANMADPFDVTGKKVFQFKGTLKEMHFHFVSSVDIEDKVKVGVANLPLSCRAFTVHSRKMCDNLIDQVPHSMPTTYREEWKSNGMMVARMYLKGAIWDENEKRKYVGIMDSMRSTLIVMRPTFRRTSPDDPRDHRVYFFGQYFDKGQHGEQKYWVDRLEPKSSVWTVSFSLKHTTGAQKGVWGDASHGLRGISCPVFDLVKGYPVQGFYRHFELPPLGTDDMYLAVEDKFRRIAKRSADSGSQPAPQQGPPAASQAGRAGAGGPPSGPDPGRGSGSSYKQSATNVALSVASILSAMSAIQLYL